MCAGPPEGKTSNGRSQERAESGHRLSQTCSSRRQLTVQTTATIYMVQVARRPRPLASISGEA